MPRQKSEYTQGRVRSSSLPNPRAANPLAANGRLIRGVVMATYVQHEDAEDLSVGRDSRNAIYCDVYTYGNSGPARRAFLREVMVLQAHGGMHEGHVWKPRASRNNLVTGVIKDNSLEPAHLDGDHVLIAFMDGEINTPIIIGAVPHPHYDDFNDTLDSGVDVPGHRMKLTLLDGEPDFWKHRGTFHGVDKDGNYVVDSTRAHGGEYSDKGQEQPAGDSDHGNQTFNVPSEAEFNIRGLSPTADNEAFRFRLSKLNTLIQQADDAAFDLQLGGGDTVHIEGNDSTAQLTLGDGAKHAAVVETLQTLYGELEQHINAHLHPEASLRSFLSASAAAMTTSAGALVTTNAPAGTALGTAATALAAAATSLPDAPASPAPGWKPAINSTKLSFPDG